MMEDEAGHDWKVLAVPTSLVTEQYEYIQELDDVEQCLLDQVEFFFTRYKELEANKWAKVTGWGTRWNAEKLIRESKLGDLHG